MPSACSGYGSHDPPAASISTVESGQLIATESADVRSTYGYVPPTKRREALPIRKSGSEWAKKPGSRKEIQDGTHCERTSLWDGTEPLPHRVRFVANSGVEPAY